MVSLFEVFNILIAYTLNLFKASKKSDGNGNNIIVYLVENIPENGLDNLQSHYSIRVFFDNSLTDELSRD
jgi:hypothetical protein